MTTSPPSLTTTQLCSHVMNLFVAKRIYHITFVSYYTPITHWQKSLYKLGIYIKTCILEYIHVLYAYIFIATFILLSKYIRTSPHSL